MVDGKQSHGGLTDRFRNILSVYLFCKDNHISFKLYYIYPCNLRYYLLPNHYNWIIDSKNLSYSYYDSKDLYIYTNAHTLTTDKTKWATINNTYHISILSKAAYNKKPIQYHIYGNAYFGAGKYKYLFNELFIPSPYLKQKIAEVKKNINHEYEAITLRFQQLLGDLKEGNFDILSEYRQKELIDKCKNKIINLYMSGYFSTNYILVTSDSAKFINVINKLSFVYTIPGKMEHMDYTQNSDIEINAKSFIDLYLLSEAKCITLLQTEKMYKSGFPKFAAELGDKPYKEIIF